MLDVVANIGYSSSVFASNVDYKDGDDDDDDDMVTWMLDGVVGLGIHFQYWPLIIHHQHTADIIIVIIVIGCAAGWGEEIYRGFITLINSAKAP